MADETPKRPKRNLNKITSDDWLLTDSFRAVTRCQEIVRSCPPGPRKGVIDLLKQMIVDEEKYLAKLAQGPSLRAVDAPASR